MADIVSRETRSRIMRAVKQRNTKPELATRSLVRELGFFYRTKNRDLPGSPDLANRHRKWAIFVNGCFWHGHRNCDKTKAHGRPRIPKQNRDYWGPKLRDNRRRDAAKCRALRQQGFHVAVVWECELLNAPRLTGRLVRFLGRTS